MTAPPGGQPRAAHPGMEQAIFDALANVTGIGRSIRGDTDAVMAVLKREVLPEHERHVRAQVAEEIAAWRCRQTELCESCACRREFGQLAGGEADA